MSRVALLYRRNGYIYSSVSSIAERGESKVWNLFKIVPVLLVVQTKYNPSVVAWGRRTRKTDQICLANFVVDAQL